MDSDCKAFCQSRSGAGLSSEHPGTSTLYNYNNDENSRGIGRKGSMGASGTDSLLQFANLWLIERRAEFRRRYPAGSGKPSRL